MDWNNPQPPEQEPNLQENQPRRPRTILTLLGAIPTTGLDKKRTGGKSIGRRPKVTDGKNTTSRKSTKKKFRPKSS